MPLAHEIKRAWSSAVSAPVGQIGFQDTLASVVDGQSLHLRTPDTYGSYTQNSAQSTDNQTVSPFANFIRRRTTSGAATDINILHPEPGREWGNTRVGLEAWYWLISGGDNNAAILTWFGVANENVAHDPRAYTFFKINNGNAYLEFWTREVGGSNTLRWTSGTIQRDQKIRFEVYRPNDSQMIFALSQEDVLIHSATYAFNGAGFGDQVGIGLQGNQGSARIYTLENTDFIVDNRSILIP